MTDLFDISDETHDEPEKFDFGSPENVLIEVVPHEGVVRPTDWSLASIESCTVISGAEGVTGAASYDKIYGGFLDYTIQDLIDCPGAGWWVVEGITGCYTRGDGYTTDDDMDFYCTGIRPATVDEISQA